MKSKSSERQKLQRNRMFLMISLIASLLAFVWILGNENLPFCVFSRNWEANYVSTGLDVNSIDEANSYLIGDSVDFLIKNETENEVFLPRQVGNGISIIELDKCNNQLGELQDEVDRSIPLEETLGPEGDPLSMALENISPAIEAGKQKVFVGICIAGYIVREREVTDEQVGGCVKVTLYRERYQMP